VIADTVRARARLDAGHGLQAVAHALEVGSPISKPVHCSSAGEQLPLHAGQESSVGLNGHGQQLEHNIGHRIPAQPEVSAMHWAQLGASPSVAFTHAAWHSAGSSSSQAYSGAQAIAHSAA
jgi:hypothetical protein